MVKEPQPAWTKDDEKFGQHLLRQTMDPNLAFEDFSTYPSLDASPSPLLVDDYLEAARHKMVELLDGPITDQEWQVRQKHVFTAFM